ncbi:MAG: tetratricopeptide repeat protein [Candidatus Nitrotoga sp.]|nr:tetratricopeptide repeat protein [Candidatus Nitrotoga sp.]MDO9447914.1 tetratricopeptide repeat protein [Candidatus Nitrotoga sp.]MDP3496557.1 tetratricopeptide repeat protein [Candidatus Nitrotoga sp.]
MDEHENLPAVFAAQVVAVQSEKRVSLVGRGLVAVQNLKNSKNDALYRQARVVFDRRGCRSSSWNEVADPAIFSAFKIFQQLADQNYGKAYYPLSILYRGRNDVGDVQSKAQHYTQLALAWCLANQANDDADLWCDMGDMHINYFQSHEIDEVCYRKAAEMGNEWAQWELAMLLHRPNGGLQELAMLLHRPNGGLQENEQAFYWMEQAAQQGDPSKQGMLGDFYDFNFDYDKAVYWYRKAAEQGDGYAQLSLGEMYTTVKVLSKMMCNLCTGFARLLRRVMKWGNGNLVICSRTVAALCRTMNKQSIGFTRPPSRTLIINGNLVKCTKMAMAFLKMMSRQCTGSVKRLNKVMK